MSLIHIKVYGIVQGVGFRPYVARLADALHILGTVANRGSCVEIYAQGTEADLSRFLDTLEHRPPVRAVVLRLTQKRLPQERDFADFSIITSARENGEIFLSPDIAICPDCQRELYDPENRRYLHPFINCTACGPRLTILESMPYDRERTSMKSFPMCAACHEEYRSPASRRYDAQPVCCPDCGPEVFLLGEEGIRGQAAITRAREVLCAGGILAVKGIGGYHLACDATSQAAVLRLRRRKHRPQKPFAVMAGNLDVIRRECRLLPGQEALLDGWQKPILLLEKKQTSRLADAVAPENPFVGMMLPYAPLQLLLFSYPPDGLDARMPDLLVMTSGNPSGAPICHTEEEAAAALSSIADLILAHNRRILIRADDSVMDWTADGPYMIRRSRGFAPLPVALSEAFSGTVLGIGGELKNTFCVGRGSLLYPSPYVGNMTDLRTMQALRETAHRFLELLEACPEVIACDLHPRYHTRAIAEELRQETGASLLPLQHHYAHVLSCLAENDVLAPVIGIAFDGTGYGPDQTIWGGEIFRADPHGYTRLGHIRPFLQAGGDRAAREGWRIALSMLVGLTHDAEKSLALGKKLALAGESSLRSQCFLTQRGLNTIESTSAGRLFDAVSALLGCRTASSFEGEAAMSLEFAALRHEKAAQPDPRAFLRAFSAFSPACTAGILPTDKLFRYLVRARLQKKPPEALAWEFHVLLAAEIVQAAEAARETTGLETAALTGGVFQNTLLLRLCTSLLTSAGFRVLRHQLIPPNDGGLCLGQALAALVRAQA